MKLEEKLHTFSVSIDSWDSHLDFYEHLIDACGLELPAIQLQTNIVPGCISKTYLAGYLKNGRLFFEITSESKIVHGFGKLLCDLFDGSSPKEILDFRFSELEKLKYKEWLTSSRQNGFKQMYIRIRNIAQDSHV